jgi:hypothetical protein
VLLLLTSFGSIPSGRAAESPAGDQLAWTLDQVANAGSGLTDAAIAAHFTAEFLSGIANPDLVAVFAAYLAPSGPMTVVRYEGGLTETRANALLSSTSGQYWRVTLSTDPYDGDRISGLFFQPTIVPQPDKKAPKSWSALRKSLTKVAPEVGFVAAEIDGGACNVLHAVNGDQELAVGSTFKLYVLGELVRQIEAGEASWDEPITLEAALKSLPSGSMLYEPNGADFPLVRYAEQMISESDNTATDHLIARLGRERVEGMFAEMGHADPARNIPLLMTREWFAMKLSVSEKVIDNYLGGSVATKRRILRDTIDEAAASLWDGMEWPGPYLIDQIEWFASAADLCHAAAWLKHEAEQPGLEPVMHALSLNPEIEFDPGQWQYVGYKGGYETGVKSNVWLLQRNDGRWFVLASVINDPKKEIDGHGLNDLMIAAASLLANEK